MMEFHYDLFRDLYQTRSFVDTSCMSYNKQIEYANYLYHDQQIQFISMNFHHYYICYYLVHILILLLLDIHLHVFILILNMFNVIIMNFINNI